VKLFRARIFTPTADPFRSEPAKSYLFYDDGYLAVDDSRIAGIGPWDKHPEGEVLDLGRNALITP